MDLSAFAEGVQSIFDTLGVSAVYRPADVGLDVNVVVMIERSLDPIDSYQNAIENRPIINFMTPFTSAEFGIDAEVGGMVVYDGTTYRLTALIAADYDVRLETRFYAVESD